MNAYRLPTARYNASLVYENGTAGAASRVTSNIWSDFSYVAPPKISLTRTVDGQDIELKHGDLLPVWIPLLQQPDRLTTELVLNLQAESATTCTISTSSIYVTSKPGSPETLLVTETFA